jgi:hypothetical protein
MTRRLFNPTPDPAEAEGVGRPKTRDSEGWGGCSGSEATGVPIDRRCLYGFGLRRGPVRNKVI